MLDLVLYTGDGCLAVDRNQKIVRWNVPVQRLLVMPPEEALGRPCYDVLRARDEHGNSICSPGCQIVTAARNGELIGSCDVTVPLRAGKRIWLSMSTAVMARDGSEPPLIMHLLRDIDERHALEQLARGTVQSVSELVQARAGKLSGERNGGPAAELTRRELEVLKLVVGGAEAAAIARRLGVSVATARKHVQSILSKLHVHNRVEATVYALHHGLVDLSDVAAHLV